MNRLMLRALSSIHVKSKSGLVRFRSNGVFSSRTVTRIQPLRSYSSAVTGDVGSGSGDVIQEQPKDTDQDPNVKTEDTKARTQWDVAEDEQDEQDRREWLKPDDKQEFPSVSSQFTSAAPSAEPHRKETRTQELHGDISPNSGILGRLRKLSMTELRDVEEKPISPPKHVDPRLLKLVQSRNRVNKFGGGGGGGYYDNNNRFPNYQSQQRSRRNDESDEFGDGDGYEKYRAASRTGALPGTSSFPPRQRYTKRQEYDDDDASDDDAFDNSRRHGSTMAEQAQLRRKTEGNNSRRGRGLNEDVGDEYEQAVRNRFKRDYDK